MIIARLFKFFLLLLFQIDKERIVLLGKGKGLVGQEINPSMM